MLDNICCTNLEIGPIMLVVSIMKAILPKLLVIAMATLLLAACGGSAATPAPDPTQTPSPTVPTSTPVPLPTDIPTPIPTNTPVPEATGFDKIVACLEDRLGTEVAGTLVAGDRQETPEEEAVLEGCLLVTASGLSAQDLSPAVTACFEERLGTGVLAIVGSGARELTSEEEAVLLDCVVTSALAPTEAEPVSSLEACLAEQLGADIAPLVASRAIPLTDVEVAALNNCLLATTLDTSAETLDAAVIACLEGQLGADIASVVASGAIPLTEEEEKVLGDCVVGSTLEAAEEEEGLNPGVAACLEERLGADIAAVVASGAIPLTKEEEAILGECLLSPSSETATETISEGLAACLEEQLGADIAAVVASGAIPLTAEEEAVIGDCLLQEALGGSS